MTVDLIFSLFLMGHILGDFYLQWDKLADGKNKSWRTFTLHCVLYAFCIGAVLFCAFNWAWELLLVAIIAAISHAIVDSTKAFIVRCHKKKEIPRFTFILDQLIHIVILIFLWFIWGQSLTVRSWVSGMKLDYISVHPLIVLLGLLCVISPVGSLIASGDIWNLSRMQPVSDESQKGAGRMIGYLERLIVFFLLLNGEFSPIGFVIAAKAVIRFPEIGNSENKRLQAEYYLIGTLLSMMSVFAISLLFGLIKVKL